MIHRFALALALAASPALAQTEAPPAPVAPPVAPAPKPVTVRVTMVTSDGAIVLELEKQRAPITTANFLRYIDQKKLDGTSFYRAVKVERGFGFVQGGARNDPRHVLPSIAHEPTSRTGLTHDDGAISMARSAPGTANGDFFIVVGGFPSMDADPSQQGDNLGFAVFGHVVEGMDVIRRIMDEPASPTAGEGVMKGQMLAAPVRIVSVRRTN